MTSGTDTWKKAEGVRNTSTGIHDTPAETVSTVKVSEALATRQRRHSCDRHRCNIRAVTMVAAAAGVALVAALCSGDGECGGLFDRLYCENCPHPFVLFRHRTQRVGIVGSRQVVCETPYFHHM